MATHRPILKLGLDNHGQLLSADEFAEADFAEPWKYERVAGRLLVMSPDGQRHLDGTGPWLMELMVYWKAHPEIVEHVVPNSWIRVDEGTDRIGDIGVYLTTVEPKPPIPDRIPDIMLEVVSPGRESRDRDYIEKRAEYETLGVDEYVIIDRDDKKVTVFTRAAKGYTECVLAADETYTSPRLPGFSLALEDIF